MSYKAGYIGFVGLPNAGKSTLVNKLIGSKVGIVTSKPQTTRQKVVGIHTDETGQYLFVDSPGLIKSETGLNKFLQEEAELVAKESDSLLAILNVDEQSLEKLETIAQWVSEKNKPWMAVVTKTDIGKEHRALILREMLKKYEVKVIEVSAAKDSSLQLQAKLLPEIAKMLPDSPAPLFDPEIYTTQNTREMCSEIIREKCFEFLHQEIPYGLGVKIDKFDESAEEITKIYAQIIISKSNHKPMLIGKSGQTIKRIGSSARTEIEKLLDVKVYLDLHVKVKQDWMKQKSVLKELGYVWKE